MRSSLMLIMIWIVLSPTVHAETRGLDVGVSLYQDNIDLNYSGNLRETRLTNLEVSWIELLAPSIYGGIELGYLELTQYSNPIPTGQTGGGGFLGLNMSFLLLDTQHFQLLTRLGYRYSEARRTTEGQTVDWDWHQGLIALEGKLSFSERFAMILGVSAIAIDGRERADGTVTQAQPFKADEPLSGHLGLQLGLDPDSTIGIQVDVGSLRGGRLIIRRVF